MPSDKHEVLQKDLDDGLHDKPINLGRLLDDMQASQASLSANQFGAEINSLNTYMHHGHELPHNLTTQNGLHVEEHYDKYNFIGTAKVGYPTETQSFLLWNKQDMSLVAADSHLVPQHTWDVKSDAEERAFAQSPQAFDDKVFYSMKLAWMAETLEKGGEYDDARKLLNRTIIFEKEFGWTNIRESIENLAAFEGRRGNTAEAGRLLQEIIKDYDKGRDGQPVKFLVDADQERLRYLGPPR